MDDRALLAVLGLGGLVVVGGVIVAMFLFPGLGEPKYSIGDKIVYQGTVYLVINNRERDAEGRLLYQLQDVATGIAYWFLVSEVDPNSELVEPGVGAISLE